MRTYLLLAAALLACSCASRGPSDISQYRWDPDDTDEAVRYEELMLASLEFGAVDATSVPQESQSFWGRFKDSWRRERDVAPPPGDTDVVQPAEAPEAPPPEVPAVEETVGAAMPPPGEPGQETRPRRGLFGIFARKPAPSPAETETAFAEESPLPPPTPAEFSPPAEERADLDAGTEARAPRRGLFGLFRREEQPAADDDDIPADLIPPEWTADESTAPDEGDAPPPPEGEKTPVFRPIAPGELIGDPIIRPGHVLSVEVVVSGRKEIEETDKRVSAAGYISLPLAGAVECNGMTPATLALKLQGIYGEYMRDPMVDVCFVVDRSEGAVSPWGSVTVLGQVRTPGRINIPPTQDLSLSMAVQLAGGLDASAKDTAIRVTRKVEDGSLETVIVNLRSAASDSRVENDILLRADDIIYVPEKVF